MTFSCMRQNVTAVFDIGKTNKKFFLFDKEFQEVYREYTNIDPIYDEDGYPAEDLTALRNWLKGLFSRILKSEAYNVKAINFSCYGASFVHLDEMGEVLTPLYNYTKVIDQKVIDCFYSKYGTEETFARETGSPQAGMLNSGMQLYWIKHTKPEIFKKIKYSLHFPQYLSFIFTGIPLSEYTSIGCHTALWDYGTKDYHSWVYAEGIHKKLPPIVSAETSINMNYNGNRIKIGVGIHDSSAALLPYVRSIKKSFILVSTGTWSITINPFANHYNLSSEDVRKDCINYMRINGAGVKASRLFLGNEYNIQVKNLTSFFGVKEDYHKTVRFDPEIFHKLSQSSQLHFRWESIVAAEMPHETSLPSESFEVAFHQLMSELVKLQISNIQTVKGKQKIENVYVDGGFSDNEIYIKLLTYYLPDMTLRTTSASLGSALGAALCISDTQLKSKFLKKNYALKKHRPFVLN